MASKKPVALKPGFKLVLFTVLFVYFGLICVMLWLGSYPSLTLTHQKLADYVVDTLKIGGGAIFGLLSGFLTDK